MINLIIFLFGVYGFLSDFAAAARRILCGIDDD